jgi:dipeptide transport system permease protein
MPIFWWGLLLILLFSVQLGWTPVSGRIAVQYFIEPVTGFLLIDALLAGDFGCVSLGTVSSRAADDRARHGAARRHRPMTRSAMLEVLGEDYIRTARAKGLPRFPGDRDTCVAQCADPGGDGDRAAGRRPIYRRDPHETIFSWPGVGKWLIEGINRRDYPVLQGGTLLIGAIVMIVNLLVDVTYGLINPRIRHTR